MQVMTSHKTRELSSRAKEVLEQLLGRQLADDEEVGIWASRPHAAPVGGARKEAWRKLNDHMDRMAQAAGPNTDELERIADEVSDEVRHGPR
jgi:hypothetical protein